MWEFPGLQWLGLCAFTAEGPGLIPDRGINPTGPVVQRKKEKNVACEYLITWKDIGDIKRKKQVTKHYAPPKGRHGILSFLFFLNMHKRTTLIIVGISG